jgi:hypothetical protein
MVLTCESYSASESCPTRGPLQPSHGCVRAYKGDSRLLIVKVPYFVELKCIPMKETSWELFQNTPTNKLCINVRV